MNLLVVDSRERLDSAGRSGQPRRRRVGACRPRMIGLSLAMCRQVWRIESAAACSWTVQVR